jgi:flavin-dependent thymidylate synthase
MKSPAMQSAFLSPEPKVTLVKGFGSDAFDNSVATARTCYSSRVITTQEVSKDEKAVALRDRIAQETFEAGHHTTIQHATFQFTLENVSRQAIWSFLHSHPFYNSEQVSQRYVEVRPGNVVLPRLEEPGLSIYQRTVELQMAAYKKLIDQLLPRVREEFFRIFPARRKSEEKWALGLKKKAQEVARYVLPIGTFAHLYHTISGLTLHRYHRLSRQLDVPTETRLLVTAMVDEVSKVDPLFFRHIQDPIPLEQTLEYQAMADLKRVDAKSSARAYVDEFDGQLGDKISRLVDFKPRAPAVVAQAVRDVLGATTAELSDAQALERVLSPKLNAYLGEALVLTTVSKLTRSLSHAHYTFQKKLSHTADSQDQRHRMTPGSRPVLHAHYVPGRVDVVVPKLVSEVPEAVETFDRCMRETWNAIEQLIDSGVSEESALYLLPNAFPIRFLESGDLLHHHHKWVHRLCYTAQDEIWRASQEEVLAVRAVHPELTRHIAPPCTLRKEAGITPFCPEGPRFCGVPVWKMDVKDFQRLI